MKELLEFILKDEKTFFGTCFIIWFILHGIAKIFNKSKTE